jgi:hypothetical protein
VGGGNLKLLDLIFFAILFFHGAFDNDNEGNMLSISYDRNLLIFVISWIVCPEQV